MINLKNIYKNFEDKRVLDDISLLVEKGELVSLLGPSGCGKTTTLKIMAGLLTPDNGDVLIQGESVLNVPVEKRGAVIVFQEYLLFPHMTIEENIGFGLKMAKVKKKVIKDKVEEMLKLVELEGHESKYPNELSGGQRQRVALARALAIEPRVLLLDEPFSNLDPKLRESMREFTINIQKKLNITTILVTHDKEEALMNSDKIAIMLDGRIEQFGTPVELYEKPSSKKVADFLGDKNYIRGIIKDGYFISDLLKIRTNIDMENNVELMVRPEEIKIIPPTFSDKKGKIISRKYAGDRIYYDINISDMDIKSVSEPSNLFEIGDEVSVIIDVKNQVFFRNNTN